MCFALNHLYYYIFCHFCLLELTIKGGHCSPYTYPKAISMIEKKQLPLEVSKENIMTYVYIESCEPDCVIFLCTASWFTRLLYIYYTSTVVLLGWYS